MGQAISDRDAPAGDATGWSCPSSGTAAPEGAPAETKPTTALPNAHRPLDVRSERELRQKLSSPGDSLVATAREVVALLGGTTGLVAVFFATLAAFGLFVARPREPRP